MKPQPSELRQTTVTPISAQVFNNVLTTYTSAAFSTGAYRRGLLIISLAVAAAPTDIVINLMFSDDDVTYYKYMLGPFGDLRYEDSAGAKAECLDFPILAPYMKLIATATGTTAVNMFSLTCKVVMNG